MKPSLRILCVLAAGCLTACGNETSSSGGSGGSAAAGGGAGTRGSAGTGGGGGTGGSDTGVVVSIPEGAGNADITISELDANDFPRSDELVSPVFDIGPSGTQFDIPITVGIPIDEGTPQGTTVELVRFDENSGEWESLGGSIIGGLIVGKTDHLTPFSAAQTPSGPGCDNVWGGGPGSIPPLHTVGGITASPGAKTSETVVFSGASEISLGSTWDSPACKVTVSGSFGPGLSGDGAWIDYSNGGGGSIPAGGGGAFSLTLETDPPDNKRGPSLGITDPCQAANGVYAYNLSIAFAADCEDLCDGVDCSDGNPCTDDTCLPTTVECEHTPTGGTCGSGANGLCVEGLCIVEVPMDPGVSGNSVCAAEGLVCAGVPVLQPNYQVACKAFHPSADVTASTSGWRQSVYCDNSNSSDLACEGKTDTCHHCLACISTGLDCATAESGLLRSLFAQCAEP